MAASRFSLATRGSPLPGVRPRYSRACSRRSAGTGRRCLARRGPGTTATACLRRRHTFAPVRRERL